MEPTAQQLALAATLLAADKVKHARWARERGVRDVERNQWAYDVSVNTFADDQVLAKRRSELQAERADASLNTRGDVSPRLTKAERAVERRVSFLRNRERVERWEEQQRVEAAAAIARSKQRDEWEAQKRIDDAAREKARKARARNELAVFAEAPEPWGSMSHGGLVDVIGLSTAELEVVLEQAGPVSYESESRRAWALYPRERETTPDLVALFGPCERRA